MFSGNPPMSVETTLHFSWDYAQIHFPHHVQQVWPSKHQGNVIILESALKEVVIIFSFTYEMFSLKFMYMM